MTGGQELRGLGGEVGASIVICFDSDDLVPSYLPLSTKSLLA